MFAPRAGVALADAPHLVPQSGGAPANVAVQLARLGVPTALVTAVGKDPFGVRLTRALADDGVDVDAVVVRAGRRTGCTLVEVDARGERSFFGFRENSADLTLGPADLNAQAARRAISRASLVHTGTVSLRSPSARAATRALQQQARARGRWVSLDVNLRPGMFPSLPLLLRLANAAVRRADIVKATREEAQQLLALPRAADDVLVDALLARGPRLVALTLGEEGAVLATRRARVLRRPAQVVTRPVDVTGAGDAFVGGLLGGLLARGLSPRSADALDDVDEAALAALVDDANACGAAVVTALGATTAMLRGAHGRASRR